MKSAENRQQQKQQRRDAGKTHQVKPAQADLRKFSPASQRGSRDQEAGNGKKYLHPGLTVPHQRPNQLAGQTRHVGNFADEQTHVDVIHQHEKDCQRAKQIHAVNSRAVRQQSQDVQKGSQAILHDTGIAQAQL